MLELQRTESAKYRDKFKNDSPSYTQGRFLFQENSVPSAFVLSNGEKLNLSCEITDITDQFFGTIEPEKRVQNNFLALLKQLLISIYKRSIYTATSTGLEMEGFSSDLESSVEDPVVADAIGDIQFAESELDKMAQEVISTWFLKISEKNRKATKKRISIPALTISYETILIGDVLLDENSWSTDEQIVNLLHFINNVLVLKLPHSFQLFAVATLDFGEIHKPGLISEMSEILDIHGYRYLNKALIFEEGFRRKGNENTEPNFETVIDLLTSQMLTTHEVSHICDVNIINSTNPQAEAFAVALQYALNFQKTVNFLLYISPKSTHVSSQDLSVIFSPEPPEHIKNWQIYGLAPALYSFIYERFGAKEFVQFYKHITKNQSNDNLNEALESIGAKDILSEFIAEINQILQPHKTV